MAQSNAKGKKKFLQSTNPVLCTSSPKPVILYHLESSFKRPVLSNILNAAG